MSSENENLNFEVVSEIDENTKVITTNDYEGMYNRLLEEAVKNYETGNDRLCKRKIDVSTTMWIHLLLP